ncbi:hypothetical protein, partial [Mucilaginibacter pankratovii]|uniref:hypothetical protein n=1 Tax=Mucilaginibacter pankratovii TaxID=2772110 RepID=UPI001CD152B7
NNLQLKGKAIIALTAPIALFFSFFHISQLGCQLISGRDNGNKKSPVLSELFNYLGCFGKIPRYFSD